MADSPGYCGSDDDDDDDDDYTTNPTETEVACLAHEYQGATIHLSREMIQCVSKGCDRTIQRLVVPYTSLVDIHHQQQTCNEPLLYTSCINCKVSFVSGDCHCNISDCLRAGSVYDVAANRIYTDFRDPETRVISSLLHDPKFCDGDGDGNEARVPVVPESYFPCLQWSPHKHFCYSSYFRGRVEFMAWVMKKLTRSATLPVLPKEMWFMIIGHMLPPAFLNAPPIVVNVSSDSEEGIPPHAQRMHIRNNVWANAKLTPGYQTHCHGDVKMIAEYAASLEYYKKKREFCRERAEEAYVKAEAEFAAAHGGAPPKYMAPPTYAPRLY